MQAEQVFSFLVLQAGHNYLHEDGAGRVSLIGCWECSSMSKCIEHAAPLVFKIIFRDEDDVVGTLIKSSAMLMSCHLIELQPWKHLQGLKVTSRLRWFLPGRCASIAPIRFH